MKTTRRLISFALAVAMMLPSLATVAEAAMVTWLSPQPGQRITATAVEVAVGYNTQSATKVSKLELWVDGKLHATKQLQTFESRGVCSFWWNTNRYSDGPHELVVKVYSGDVLISKVTSTGTVGDSAFDIDPPIVVFSGIKTGDVLKGTTQIKLDARDNSGEAPLVSLLVDDSLKLVKNRPPYTYDLNTTTYTDGSHELETYAYDGAGNKSNPAVVNVTFKNNAERPVVTSVTVAPASRIAASEDDGTGVIVEAAPVVKVPPVAAPSVRTQAARSAEAPRVTPAAAKPVAPVVSAPVKAVAPRPVVSVVVAPKVAVQPKATAAPKTAPGMQVTKPVERVSARTPEVVAKAKELANKPMQVIARPPAELAPVVAAEPAASAPSTRSESHSMASQPVVQPRQPVNPDAASPKPVLIAKAPSVREMQQSGLVSSSAGAQEMLADPVSADIQVKAESEPVTGLRADNQAGMASVGKRIALAPPAPKPVRAVASPYVNDVNAKPKVTIKQLPPAKIESDAKLEKKLIPASGKIKIRDLINKLGGIVFWDKDTHTVTAYAGDLQIVFEIGSKTAMVNGKEMRMDHAPFIANGRTIISAQAYHQALTFAGNSKVASAKK